MTECRYDVVIIGGVVGLAVAVEVTGLPHLRLLLLEKEGCVPVPLYSTAWLSISCPGINRANDPELHWVTTVKMRC